MHQIKKYFSRHIYDTINIILLNLLFIIPMTRIDYTSYVSHDARWWLNQYYEYYHTIWHPNPVAFNGFNHTGLIINSAYPNIILKAYETPLVLMHIQNPYLVIGIQTLLLANIFVILYYTLLKQLNVETNIRLTLSLFFTSVMVLTGRGIVNSIPQLLATAFILLGVISIIGTKKEWLMVISVVGLLGSSLTTSAIGLITFALVFFIQPTKIKFKKLFKYGLIGSLIMSYNIYSIIRTVASVQKPYQHGMQKFPTFFIENILKGDGMVFITVAFFLFLVPLLFHQKETLNKYIASIVSIYLLLSAFPKFSAILMTPIQQGTFQRIWTIFAIIIVFWIVPISTKNNKIIIALSTSILIMLSSLTYIYYPITHAVQTPFVKALHNKQWDKLYAIINTDMLLQDKSKQLLMKATTYDTAKISPDYIPKNATLKENIIAYSSPHTMFKKYGVTKYPVNSNTVRVRVQKNNFSSTPLGVWHYNFIKYHASSDTGHITIKNGMYYYNGHKPAIITIKSINHD